MTRASAPRKRTRGTIDVLPSGALRVRVYAGIDPVSRKPHYLTEIISTGPAAAKEAEKARARFLNQVDEQRSPRTLATVNELLDRHLEMLSVEETTLDSYETFIRNHIRPLIGHVQVGRVNGEVLDSLYQQLRTCRAHCRGRKFVQHRTKREHECDERCKPHQCRPLKPGSLLKIQAILNGAGKRAVRWGWIGRNPFELAEPIPASRPDPQPPTAELNPDAYDGWSFQDLAEALAEHGVTARKSDGVMVIRAADITRALTERDQNGHDDDD